MRCFPRRCIQRDTEDEQKDTIENPIGIRPAKVTAAPTSGYPYCRAIAALACAFASSSVSWIILPDTSAVTLKIGR